MEIERKWIVDLGKVSHFFNFGYRIEQHYLNDLDDEWLIRVRNMMGKYTMTLKGKGFIERPEIEFTINEWTFEEAIAYSKRKLFKTRFRIDLNNGIVYEFDVFDDYDFVICEIEFPSVKNAVEYDPPEWCLEEVTTNPEYTNYNLAE